MTTGATSSSPKRKASVSMWRCSALQRVAVRCSALQRVAVCHACNGSSVDQRVHIVVLIYVVHYRHVLRCVAVCCGVLQCVAIWISHVVCITHRLQKKERESGREGVRFFFWVSICAHLCVSSIIFIGKRGETVCVREKETDIDIHYHTLMCVCVWMCASMCRTSSSYVGEERESMCERKK